jgi:geranylgeranylglycerol-phosphate geranylgeranyltransferase
MNLISYWKLFSPEYMPMAITTALFGAVATSNTLSDYRFIIVALAICCVIGAFNAYNAIADKEIDKVNRLDRPLPMGHITEKRALHLAIILYVIALILSAIVSVETWIIMVISVVITIAYSFPKLHLKKQFLVGTISVSFFYASLCFALGWSLSPTLEFPLSLAVFLFILGAGLSITKDFMDFAGDSFHGAKTLPVKFGYNKSIAIIIAILTFAFALLFFIIEQGIIEAKFYVLLLFYPIMVSNVFLFKKYSKNFDSKGLFTQIMLLIIALEIGYVALKIIIA